MSLETHEADIDACAAEDWVMIDQNLAESSIRQNGMGKRERILSGCGKMA